MSFASEIHPLRNQRIRFINALLSKVDREFTRVERVPGSRKIPGGGRCGWGKCDFKPIPSDRAVVKALLRGWKRELSDRFIDLPTYESLFRTVRVKSVDQAYDLIRLNWTNGGCVQFLFNQLSNPPTGLFGSKVTSIPSYNQYFSRLMAWDDKRCFGLMNFIAKDAGRFAAADEGVHIYHRAATRWIRYQQKNKKSIYYAATHN